MSEKFTRRDFLKIASAGAATAAVVTGCGPVSRYVTRQPYYDMPEYNQTGVSTYYATTCRECPAGCGIIVRTREGRAIKVEGNPNHPVNRGKVCSTGLTSVQGLYNPDRVVNPVQQNGRGSGAFTDLEWDAAVEVVRGAFQSNAQGVNFMLGLAPDHLYDLASELAAAHGAPPPVRYSALGMFDGRNTLRAATGQALGIYTIPFFDLAQADTVLAFGDILGGWVSPVAYNRAYGAMRQGRRTRRGYFVALEPSMTLTGSNADEWYPITPGSEGIIALAIGRLAGEMRGMPSAAFGNVDVAATSQEAGISEEVLHHLAQIFAESSHPLAIPGNGALGHSSGLAIAQAILNLNQLVGNIGQVGGVQLSMPGPIDPAEPQDPAAAHMAADAASVTGLINRMQSGQVQALLIHGVNPVFDLPAGYGFQAALANVPLVISFSSFPDETSQQADYIFPDHTGLESWGYQRQLAGSDRPALSGGQPVVVPLYNTRSTVDVLLAATTGTLPYQDEVQYVQAKITPVIGQTGMFTATDLPTFWAQWLQNGGWWSAGAMMAPPGQVALPDQPPAAPANPPLAEGEFHLVTNSTVFGDGSGANRPWLQETPNPLTTAMWNSWVQIHPQAAARLGVTDDDVVRISSPAGEVEAIVYRYPAIRPDTVAVPFGQGHTALGRYAQGRGFNPANLFTADINEGADPVYASTRVQISKTGRRQQLARLESREGVYGESFNDVGEGNTTSGSE